MYCNFSRSPIGFTLLEVLLALFIAVTITAVTVPGMASVLAKSPARRAFDNFDTLVQEAHFRSRAEGRAYVLVWSRDKAVVLRAEEPATRAEAEGLKKWDQAASGELELHLPAALLRNGKKPDAIWTFWADGSCEPAEIRYKCASRSWSASYNPFTIHAEVRFE